MLQSGQQRCQYHHIRMNQGEGASYVIPVPWFVVTHPQGNIVIDGGLAVEGLACSKEYWGAGVEEYQPLMSADQGCVSQLTQLGIDPDTVRYVVLSHLHSDHTGGIGRFPGATHLVQQKEYDYAFAPDWFASGAYCRKDFDRQGLKWQFLQGDDTDEFDLYGDGVLNVSSRPATLPAINLLSLRCRAAGYLLWR